MRYLIILAIGIAIGSFGVVATVKATGRTISKVVEVGSVVVDSVSPVVVEAYKETESAIGKVSK